MDTGTGEVVCNMTKGEWKKSYKSREELAVKNGWQSDARATTEWRIFDL